MASFGAELAELIQEHYPLALKGDRDQIMRVSVTISATFGGLIAMACRLQNEAFARAVVETICRDMLRNATAIEAKAIDILRDNAQR